MHERLRALLIAAGAIAALAACGDPTALEARLNNIEGEFSVHALNGSHPNTLNAVRVRTAGLQRATFNFDFDIAFDLTDTGTVRLITARALATEIVPTMNRVGLRDSPGLIFEQVTTDPPDDLFIYDSVLVVPVGRVVLIDVLDFSCAGESIIGLNIKAKLRIDSIVPADRRIHMRIVSNPNCGFRDLVPGGQKPED
jgi:hypothetical protein